jgi:uncharacterized protein YacL
MMNINNKYADNRKNIKHPYGGGILGSGCGVILGILILVYLLIWFDEIFVIKYIGIAISIIIITAFGYFGYKKGDGFIEGILKFIREL